MRQSLGNLLIEAGVASADDVNDAISEGQQTGERFGEIVIRKGIVTDEQMAKLLADQWHLEYLEAGQIEVDDLAARRISSEHARSLGAKPIRYDGNTLVLAVAEPNTDRFAALAQEIGDVAFVVVSGPTMEWLLSELVPERETAESFVNSSRKNGSAPHAPEPRVERPEEPVAAAEPAAVAADPSVDAAIASIDKALEKYMKFGETLGQVLPLVREQLAGQQAALLTLEEARRQDRKTIEDLESELSRQSARFQALREQAAAFAATIDADASS